MLSFTFLLLFCAIYNSLEGHRDRSFRGKICDHISIFLSCSNALINLVVELGGVDHLLFNIVEKIHLKI